MTISILMILTVHRRYMEHMRIYTVWRQNIFYTVLCKLFVIQTLLFLIYFDEYFLFFNKKLLLFSLFNKWFLKLTPAVLYTVGPPCSINKIIIKVSLVIFSLIKYLHNGKSRSISAFFMVHPTLITLDTLGNVKW